MAIDRTASSTHDSIGQHAFRLADYAVLILASFLCIILIVRNFFCVFLLFSISIEGRRGGGGGGGGGLRPLWRPLPLNLHLITVLFLFPKTVSFLSFFFFTFVFRFFKGSLQTFFFDSSEFLKYSQLWGIYGTSRRSAWNFFLLLSSIYFLKDSLRFSWNVRDSLPCFSERILLDSRQIFVILWHFWKIVELSWRCPMALFDIPKIISDSSGILRSSHWFIKSAQFSKDSSDDPIKKIFELNRNSQWKLQKRNETKTCELKTRIGQIPATEKKTTNTGFFLCCFSAFNWDLIGTTLKRIKKKTIAKRKKKIKPRERNESVATT